MQEPPVSDRERPVLSLAPVNTMPSSAPPAPHHDGAAGPTLGDVVARIAAEVSMPLTAALERVMALTSSGRIDRPSLQALRDEIDDARRVGLRGQQIARFASGEVQQNPERLDLASMLRGVLDEQAQESPGKALGAARVVIGTAEVVGDASLVHAVLQAAADWSAAHARAAPQWRLEVQAWPVRARVMCRLAHQSADLVAPGSAEHGAPQAPAHHENSLDTLDWLLLQYTAHIAGVSVRRDDSPSHSHLTLEFGRTVNVTLEGATAVDLTGPDAAVPSIAGCQVLVLSARRETRQRLREALQGQDLLIDYVSTSSAAIQYCEDGAPQMLVYESSLDGEALRSLRQRLSRLVSGVAMIEILPQGQQCEMGDGTPDGVTRLGAEALRQMLPPVMALEMARRRQL